MQKLTPSAAYVLLLAFGLFAQDAPPAPRLVRIANTFRPANGLAVSPVESLTLSIYRGERGGDPLWSETQNVNVDPEGRYSALMGVSLAEGLSPDLFASGEARWLGLTFNRPGEVEQPRMLFVGVPYAMKAADAETLGGLPASAYLLSPEAEKALAARASGVHAPFSGHPLKLSPRVTSGTAGYIAQFVNSTDLGNSLLFQSGSNVGVGTTSPSFALDFFSPVAGPSAAFRVGNGTADNRLRVESTQPYALGMKNGIGGTYAWMGVTPSGHYQFSDQSGNPLVTIQQGGSLGIGTTAPTSKLDVRGDIQLTGVLKSPIDTILRVPFGPSNIGLGYVAFNDFATGTGNVAIGGAALMNNTTGSNNIAVGYAALAQNTAGVSNTAVGWEAGWGNTTGQQNTAFGESALVANTTGSFNAATGRQAMQNNVQGSNNTADGFAALFNNLSGDNNIAIGDRAAFNVSGGSSNNIHIGSRGASPDNGLIRVGTPGTHLRFFAAGIRGVATVNNDAVPVVVDSAGQLGTVSSSRRFKEDIQDMNDASRGLMRLRPVTFRYRQPFGDGSKPMQYGLIAEEVAEVYPDLVARSSDGQIETVKYQSLNVLLLNEVQKQQTEIDAQRRLIHQLEERLARLETAPGERR